MTPTNTGLRRLVPANTIGLGTFVVNPDDPMRAFYTPVETPPQADVQATKVLNNDGRDAHGGVNASLSRLLSAGLKLASEVNVDLKAAKTTLAKLLNYDDWFATVCKTEKTRLWFEKQLERYGAKDLRLYFIVELQTVQGATIVLRNSSSVEARMKASVPVTEILGDPGVLSSLIDPSISLDGGLLKSSGQSFSLAEAVYGWRYAQVKFKYKRRKTLRGIFQKAHPPDIAESLLDTDTRWKVMGVDAGEELEGSGSEEDDAEDMIEAYLCGDQDEEEAMSEEEAC